MESKYEKQRVLGHGTFGRVWLVKGRQDHKLYCMKEMDVAAPGADTDARTEAQVHAGLRHPHIISYEEVSRRFNYVYLVMEYAAQGDLASLLTTRSRTRRPLTEENVLVWTNHILQALAYMHRRGMVHRDVKSANIFIMDSGIAKLGDMGCSKVLEQNATRIEQRTCSTPCGTPMYQSPEQCDGTPYTQKVDIWALGCVVYEMCALRPTFDARNIHELGRKIKGAAYNRKLPAVYSQDVRSLIDTMLTIDVYRRPAARDLVRRPCIAKYSGCRADEHGAAVPFTLGDEVKRPSFEEEAVRLPQRQVAFGRRSAEEPAGDQSPHGGHASRANSGKSSSSNNNNNNDNNNNTTTATATATANNNNSSGSGSSRSIKGGVGDGETTSQPSSRSPSGTRRQPSLSPRRQQLEQRNANSDGGSHTTATDDTTATTGDGSYTSGRDGRAGVAASSRRLRAPPPSMVASGAPLAPAYPLNRHVRHQHPQLNKQQQQQQQQQRGGGDGGEAAVRRYHSTPMRLHPSARPERNAHSGDALGRSPLSAHQHHRSRHHRAASDVNVARHPSAHASVYASPSSLSPVARSPARGQGTQQQQQQQEEEEEEEVGRGMSRPTSLHRRGSASLSRGGMRHLDRARSTPYTSGSHPSSPHLTRQQQQQQQQQQHVPGDVATGRGRSASRYSAQLPAIGTHERAASGGAPTQHYHHHHHHQHQQQQQQPQQQQPQQQQHQGTRRSGADGGVSSLRSKMIAAGLSPQQQQPQQQPQQHLGVPRGGKQQWNVPTGVSFRPQNIRRHNPSLFGMNRHAPR
ncbi:NEK protein kinase [Salpingoeca rosetta]|uniref:non-specific serine/threonine protein kinase n=1 Tax=Salpingoeca rosetta (strain ATCC 50818 / BSB-021) TaxID=946362 RepID=F2U1C1_SALR5|nr:NEK protein kinase [Salpingoeca rosetta]EGD81423.1 NEK protein kinase [Salpingoeca rosetta]|eukprot:XP_004996627.1 NEK protein kinase [Salpingoeca rosetta]